jgi:NAD(P)-dependent dehydrogenase (short-subunit alcohol dehydrogenase family)
VRTPAYAAVKALVINYTASQAAALAKDGIRVNAVAPGSIEFPGGTWEKRRAEDPALYQRILGKHPLRPARRAGGSGGCRALPRLPRRALGDGADHRRRWRADADLNGTPGLRHSRHGWPP